MISVTIDYGAGNQAVRTYNTGATVATVLADSALRGLLGFGTNVDVYVANSKVSSNYFLNSGDRLSIVQRANEKA